MKIPGLLVCGNAIQTGLSLSTRDTPPVVPAPYCEYTVQIDNDQPVGIKKFPVGGGAFYRCPVPICSNSLKFNVKGYPGKTLASAYFWGVTLGQQTGFMASSLFLFLQQPPTTDNTLYCYDLYANGYLSPMCDEGATIVDYVCPEFALQQDRFVPKAPEQPIPAHGFAPKWFCKYEPRIHVPAHDVLGGGAIHSPVTVTPIPAWGASYYSCPTPICANSHPPHKLENEIDFTWGRHQDWPCQPTDYGGDYQPPCSSSQRGYQSGERTSTTITVKPMRTSTTSTAKPVRTSTTTTANTILAKGVYGCVVYSLTGSKLPRILTKSTTTTPASRTTTTTSASRAKTTTTTRSSHQSHDIYVEAAVEIQLSQIGPPIEIG